MPAGATIGELLLVLVNHQFWRLSPSVAMIRRGKRNATARSATTCIMKSMGSQTVLIQSNGHFCDIYEHMGKYVKTLFVNELHLNTVGDALLMVVVLSS
jgi:hypothetical protein